MPFIKYAAGYSTLLTEQGRTAEALAIAQSGFRAAEGVRAPSLLEKAADALADAYYANGMADSAFVYAKHCIAYRDSVTATQNRSQLKSQLFAQQIKDIEDAKLRAEEVAARSRNIQFGIIALIVITLGIFLLVFSRTSVVGAKTIKNLSLVALLLLFEFINLLLHPLLGRGDRPLTVADPAGHGGHRWAADPAAPPHGEAHHQHAGEQEQPGTVGSGATDDRGVGIQAKRTAIEAQ